ncbi:sigma-70 family RNA polymerase sigma factor [Acetobacteraceae bacterium H6797]|nr:sigma-70 family RNA polymerase sigma factor [Acetobacteraceae bacterium H6797]
MTSSDTSFRRELPAHVPALRGFARALARDAALADDLVQETILLALRAEAQWAPDTSLRAWLFTILRNAWLGQARKRQREARHQASIAQDEAVSAPQHAQSAVTELERALDTLSPTQREAIILVGAQGLTTAEAAKVCGVPENTIKARVMRARASLAAWYGEQPRNR